MKKISKSIFIGFGHKVMWNQNTNYIQCECKNFEFTGVCDGSLKVKDILESEGKKVKFKKVKQPLFTKEIDVFSNVLREVFSGTVKIKI